MLSLKVKQTLLSAAVLNLFAAAANAATFASTGNLIAQSALAVQVTNCNESGSGSLRDLLFAARNNEFIEIPTMCSKITLTSGALREGSSPSSVNIVGYGTVIDGDYRDRVIVHSGSGTLYLSGVTVTKGLYGGPFGGGCVYSAGGVQLTNVTISNCTLSAHGGFVYGGGVYAKHAIRMRASTLSNNHVSSETGRAAGGGAFAAEIQILGSPYNMGANITDNTASGGTDSLGGGLCASNDLGSGALTISSSTVNHNEARKGAAFYAYDANLHNATVSGNISKSAAISGAKLTLSNSTIANNVTDDPYPAVSVGEATITSSIIAKSINADGSPAIDLDSSAPADISKSLIGTASFALPKDVLRGDPKLGPLQWNGGRTRTHALLPGSPAINRGDGVAADFDQRGKPYSRIDGSAADIGAIENSDRLFYDGLDL